MKPEFEFSRAVGQQVSKLVGQRVSQPRALRKFDVEARKTYRRRHSTVARSRAMKSNYVIALQSVAEVFQYGSGIALISIVKAWPNCFAQESSHDPRFCRT